MCRLSLNLGASASWNPHSLSRPVMGLLYRDRTFTYLPNIWTGSVVQAGSCLVGIKSSVLLRGHSPSSNAEINNVQSCTSTPTYAFMVCKGLFLFPSFYHVCRWWEVAICVCVWPSLLGKCTAVPEVRRNRALQCQLTAVLLWIFIDHINFYRSH